MESVYSLRFHFNPFNSGQIVIHPDIPDIVARTAYSSPFLRPGVGWRDKNPSQHPSLHVPSAVILFLPIPSCNLYKLQTLPHQRTITKSEPHSQLLPTHPFTQSSFTHPLPQLSQCIRRCTSCIKFICSSYYVTNLYACLHDEAHAFVQSCACIGLPGHLSLEHII